MRNLLLNVRFFECAQHNVAWLRNGNSLLGELEGDSVTPRKQNQKVSF